MMPTLKGENSTLRRYFDEARWFAEETWIGYTMVLPATVLMAIIILYPTAHAIWISFFEQSFLNPEATVWVGLQNYQRLLDDPTFSLALVQTIIFTVGSVTSMYFLGLGLAMALKQRLPGMGMFRSLTMVPWVIPPVVIVIIWDWMLQVDYGLVNLLLQMVGGPNQYWFGTTEFALPLVMMLRVWKDAPFVAIALMASMQSIPNELYEAAEMDGASALQQFRYITLPNITYISMVLIVLETAAAFNSFQTIWLATGGGPVNATEVLATYIYSEAFQQYALGYASSVGVVMLLILGVFTVVYVRLEDTE